jgi:hypothetical protein
MLILKPSGRGGFNAKTPGRKGIEGLGSEKPLWERTSRRMGSLKSLVSASLRLGVKSGAALPVNDQLDVFGKAARDFGHDVAAK